MVTSLCIYRVKPGSEDAFRTLLGRHWPTLREVGLAGSEPPTIYQGTEKPGEPIFVELLTWNSEEGPNTAHEVPEVMSIWEPMGMLCETRDGRPSMEFPHVQPIQVEFER